MVAQPLLRGLAARRGHTLPEGDGIGWVVACHGGKDQAHIVGFALILAAVFQIEQGKARASYLSGHVGSVLSCHCSEHASEHSGRYALVLLLRHLLGTVFRHGVGDLVSQHDGQGGLVLRVGQDAFEDDDLASGHAESVGLWVLDEVELPVEVVHLTGEAVVSEVGLDGIGEVAPYAYHHLGVGCVGRFLRLLHIGGILLLREGEQLLVAHADAMFASCQGDSLGGTTCGHQ